MRIFPLPAFLVACLIAGPAVAAPCGGEISRACLLDEAREIAAAQQPPIARIRSQIAIAETMAGAGDMAGARALFAFVWPDVAALDDSWLRDQLTLARITALAPGGNISEITALINGLNTPSFVLSARLVHAGMLVDKGAPDQAIALARKVLAQGAQIEDAFLRQKLSETIALTLARAGDFKRAEQVARAIGAPGLRPQAMVEVAEIMGESGNNAPAIALIEAALAGAHMLEPGVVRASDIARAAQALARLGLVDRALELRASQQAAPMRVRLENAIVLGVILIDSGARLPGEDFPGRKMLAETRRLGAELNAPDMLANGLIAFGEAYTALPEPARALTLLHEAQALLQARPEGFGRLYGLGRLAVALAGLGQLGEAGKIAQAIEAGNLRAAVLARIAVRLEA